LTGTAEDGANAGTTQNPAVSPTPSTAEQPWDAGLTRLLPTPLITARIKQTPEDFQVDEILGFEPDGEGNHWLLHIRKISRNTSEVSEFLSKSSGCSEADVGFCGLKDRQAVTTQWFSIPIGRATDPVDPNSFTWPDGVELLECVRHGKKLRRGIHRGNRFRIVLREVEGAVSDWQRRIVALQDRGFPNYFTAQRFGRGGSNLALLRRMGEAGKRRRWNRRDRNWGLSTLRALIFNRVLSERLRCDTVSRVQAGDVLNLVGSRSRFVAEPGELPGLQARVDQRDLAVTGPLWGETEPPTSGAARAFEQAAAEMVLQHYGEAGLLGLLKSWRAEQDRRPLMVVPEGLTSGFDERGGAITVGFNLPRGSYATAVLRELVDLVE